MVDRFSNQLAQSSVHRAKTVIIGDFNVGKTSVALRFTRDQFKEKYQSTIAASFFANSLDFNGEKIAFQIWDTAGQERYRSLIPMYLRGSEAAIIVYDITSKASFKGVHFWLGFLRDNGPQGLKIAIIGNKLDLEASREVSEKSLLWSEKSQGYGSINPNLVENHKIVLNIRPARILHQPHCIILHHLFHIKVLVHAAKMHHSKRIRIFSPKKHSPASFSSNDNTTSSNPEDNDTTIVNDFKTAIKMLKIAHLAAEFLSFIQMEVESFCDERRFISWKCQPKQEIMFKRLFTDIAKSILSGDKTQRRSILRQSSIKIDTSTHKHKHRCCHRGEYTVQKE
ncbi:RAB22 [Mytilus edulis]|uniref:RAB22 n=1 Tax=Mytilus edulis TaxID=6550 RepID=A0A8S3UZY3_MYTED|nr:RAB22 [Mytilus edulis]